jgi:predicted amidophosphoribosyltransferase
MKHLAERPLIAAMGNWMSQQLRDAIAGDPLDVLVPVPKHWWRRIITGINTAEVLAEQLATGWRVPAVRALRSVRNPKKQSLLSWSQRQTNMRRAFGMRPGCELPGAHVGLVDDIMTSCATAQEAASVLKKGGAARVTVIVVGRAPHPDQVVHQPRAALGM